MSERQTVQRWMITVGGVEQARVGAGQTVEIGRKPIRPLREDGFTRIDIVDNKRSMSKRHALLIVGTNGVATIRDLHSTNGTYLVGANGDLLRLEPDVDFQLPDNLMRMQFGDVPVDFVHVKDEVTDETQDHEVRDLFSYATDNVHEEHDEPDAANLSVDQILDLRAGEPTGIFHSQSVSQPGLSWQQGVQTQNPLENNSQDSNSSINQNVELPVVCEQKEEPVEPRNLFADAKAMQPEDKNPEDKNINYAAQTNSADNIANQSNANAVNTNAVNASVVNTGAINANPINANQINTNPTNMGAINGISNNIVSNNGINELNNAGDVNNAGSISDISNAGDVSDINDINLSNDSAYTPAFEPGSVFEKVSKGEFDAQQNIVEAGGFTSQEAEETADFSKQFEMAQYPELLPYLAANPGLYDDLYVWLQAQGNAEVDAALARNSGYSSYRKAIEQ